MAEDHVCMWAGVCSYFEGMSRGFDAGEMVPLEFKDGRSAVMK